MPAVRQLVDHAEQPRPAPFVSQPVALYKPDAHAAVLGGQLPLPPPPGHVLVPAPVHVPWPALHTQPKKSDEDVEVVVGHVPAHTDTGPPLVLIAMSWKAPAAHAVQTMSDDAVPAAE